MVNSVLESFLGMSPLVLVAVTIVSSLFLYLLFKKDYRGYNLPGGSLGFPLIGESISFLRAQLQDRGDEWIHERVLKHGPVFKTHMMGSPTFVITGQPGNKFVFGADYDIMSAKPPKTLAIVAGEYSLSDLPKPRYLLVKQGMVSFLKAESLQHHVKHMDRLIKASLLRETKDRDVVQAVQFMKNLTFEVACCVLFGVDDEVIIKGLMSDFAVAFKAFWSIPINLPGTNYTRGLAARKRIVEKILPIIQKKKEELANGTLSPRNDVIACFLSIGGENVVPLSDLEIIDNFIFLMIASHDTAANLSSMMIWKLARDKQIYNKIREEHLSILAQRQGGDETLTWVEVNKMKYTWSVAQELMRVIPPLFGNFRTTTADTSFAGYDLPKGWQVFWVACETHMDKNFFEDPTTFDPSRFEAKKPIPPCTYIPFGAGMHQCIGNEYARVKTLTIVHHLVTRFEWSQVNPEEKIARQPLPYPSTGLPIKLTSKAAE
ncbi:Cytochrome p450 [Thalictrum thalictroides]|uniref:Cytochrome p450 n=1 Tax=Thalictrum thalictroides TaxID=46969 RepID=A0A7J6XGN5_THATH|nr:Cytochrome p450 [Thalictrum thalictroides]